VTVAQRISGYARIPDERYQTFETWPVLALLSQLPTIGPVWDPCDDGDGHLVATLRRAGIEAIGTGPDFLRTAPPMSDITDIVTNPPLGPNRRGELAVAFIEHALRMPVRRIAMLLPIDFDSAVTRQHLLRHCPAFTGKIVLLTRIRWIPGSTGSPSTNHAWFLFDRTNVGPPTIRYMSKREVEQPGRASAPAFPTCGGASGRGVTATTSKQSETVKHE
jgi:hypothetical protein